MHTSEPQHLPGIVQVCFVSLKQLPPIDVFCGIRHQAWQQEILKMLPPWTKKISQMLDQIESSGI